MSLPHGLLLWPKAAQAFSTRLLLLALCALPMSGCYLMQAATGQMAIVSKREPITDVLADAGTSQSLRGRLEKGEDVARVLSGQAGEKGEKGDGDLGWFAHDDLAARGRLFYENLVHAEAGRWLGPLKWDRGYAVVRIEEIQEPQTRPFEQSENRVRRSYARRRGGEMREALIDEVFRSHQGELSPALAEAPSPAPGR